VIIGVPRIVIVGIAAAFSLYHVVLGLLALEPASSVLPVFSAMGLYLAATALALVPIGPARMPVWIAAFSVAIAVAIPLLVTRELDPDRAGGNGYATWYVAAVGTLMTITSTRRRQLFAWAGTAFLVVQTVIWAGPTSLIDLGVIGSVSWVVISNVITRSIAKATKDARRFAYAEREAADWQAAQEAHVFERQFRLGQTSTMALPMLRRIVATDGELSHAERLECLLLEGAIRDEIRGRNLLNDAVREQVMVARRRGAVVTLLDEGGLDQVTPAARERMLSHLAEAMRTSTADKFIVRTANETSPIGVTVVGLRSAGGGAEGGSGRHAGAETSDGGSSGSPEPDAGGDEDDEVELWLEIPRS
jgi:hypothetical protein